MKKTVIISLINLILACNNEQELKINNNILTLPGISYHIGDSSSVFSTASLQAGKAVLLMYFNPDCEFCKEETLQLRKYAELFQNVRFIFLTCADLPAIDSYIQEFDLKKYSNITVGRDYLYSQFKVYNITKIPTVIIYSKKLNLVRIYNGNGRIDEIISDLQ